jgi:membrane protease YdiL (CAAX protease family)
MFLTTAQAEMTEPARRKRSSAIACFGVGVGCIGLLRVLRVIQDQISLALTRPDAIPEMWWIADRRATTAAVRELIALALFAGFLRWRGLRLADLGFRKAGTRTAWVAAFIVLALGLASHPFVRSGPYPLTFYSLYAALAIGIPVALFEESVFRGFAITTLQAGGFGVPAQILLSGFLFGLVHVAYIGPDWTVSFFTGVLGCIWAWIYIKSGNSLWPTLVAHAINDAVVMPYFYVHGVY